MLRFITSIDQLNMEKLLDVYEESNFQFGQVNCRGGTDREQLRLGEENMRMYLYDFFRTEGTILAIYTAGDIIASAARLERYKDGYLLSGLETIPSLRNYGYASVLMKGILNQISDPIYSHVQKNNLASIAVHKNAGYFVLSDCAKLLDGTVSHSYFTLKYLKKASV